MRFVPLMVLIVGLWAISVLADDLPARCPMMPEHQVMHLPNRGLTWLPNEEFSGVCGDVPPQQWMRKSSGAMDLFVYVDGPTGSGRYWDVTIGVAGRRDLKPVRGICFTTSTAGWRTLQRYKKDPLPWMDDLDSDGRAELIVWSSFPLHDDASLAEYGLMGWVYRFAAKNSLVIDWNLSRRLARSIAEEYRAPLDTDSPYRGRLRTEAAEALERFADERCKILPINAR
ncbi:MAG: hypothetical protein AB2L11_01655 [Syntrophobacteraceae bacterium]